jgi:ubiquitin carboxyl-terminal hydrolase 22/27/51
MYVGKNHEIIPAPVGMYNLGNTCFQSAILQCLVHCEPFQLYFLKEVGHDHRSCAIHRKATVPPPGMNTTSQAAAGSKPRGSDVCLACEMDVLYLQYLGRTIGKNVEAALADADCSGSRSEGARKANFDDSNYFAKGEPLITADMLTVAWKSGGMDHLVGYEQRDAHEYLHAFLEILGEHVKQYRDQVFSSLNQAGPYAFEKQDKVSQGTSFKVFFDFNKNKLRCAYFCNHFFRIPISFYRHREEDL